MSNLDFLPPDQREVFRDFALYNLLDDVTSDYLQTLHSMETPEMCRIRKESIDFLVRVKQQHTERYIAWQHTDEDDDEIAYEEDNGIYEDNGIFRK